MRRLLPVSAIIGLAIGLSGQSSPPSPNKLEESPSAPCTVVGRILNAVDGSPFEVSSCSPGGASRVAPHVWVDVRQ